MAAAQPKNHRVDDFVPGELDDGFFGDARSPINNNVGFDMRFARLARCSPFSLLLLPSLVFVMCMV